MEFTRTSEGELDLWASAHKPGQSGLAIEGNARLLVGFS